jgi:hypothetical protein
MIKLYFATEDALVVLTTEGGQPRCDFLLKGSNIGCVTVDPLHPQFIYCGTFGSGLWRSDNGGESWRPAGKGIRHSKVQSVTVSRSERVKGRGIVYAGTEPSAIFRSEDAGETWRECGDLTALPSATEWSFPPRPETCPRAVVFGSRRRLFREPRRRRHLATVRGRPAAQIPLEC